MNNQQSTTRDRIIETATELFWARGYERTTLMDIQNAAGVHGGSVYHFFKTKKEIAQAVIERYRERFDTDLIEPVFSRFEDPIDRVFGLLDGYRTMLVRTRYSRGCPIGALALELSDLDEEAREGIVAVFDAWWQAVERCLQDAASGREDDVDTEELARFVLTVMEGAVLQTRAYRDLRAFDASVAQLRRYVDSLWRPMPPQA